MIIKEKNQYILNGKYWIGKKSGSYKVLEQKETKEGLALADGEIEIIDNIRRGKNTKDFYNNKIRDFEGEARKNTQLGALGEELVVDYEKTILIKAGREDLAELVRRTCDYAGNAEKFDVLSYDENGTEKYIEVKTTRGGLNNIFHISESEVAFSWEFADKYYLYRVYDLNPKTKSAKFKILRGAITREKLTATEYTCRLGEKI